MSGTLSRRSVLAGAGYAAATGALATPLLSLAEAQEAVPSGAAAPSLCLTMVFPNVPKAKLDQDRYISKHLPLLRRIYGDSVGRMELRTAQASLPGLPPASVNATSHLWIQDARAFSQALNANSKDINADLDSVARGPRIVQVDRVVASAGDPLDQVGTGSEVFSTFYRVPEGKTLDFEYFKATHISKLYTLFGSNAARRIDGTQGQDQGASKATYAAATHIFSRDRGAFENALKQGLNDMIDDIKKYTTALPEFTQLRVQAVA